MWYIWRDLEQDLVSSCCYVNSASHFLFWVLISSSEGLAWENHKGPANLTILVKMVPTNIRHIPACPIESVLSLHVHATLGWFFCPWTSLCPEGLSLTRLSNESPPVFRNTSHSSSHSITLHFVVVVPLCSGHCSRCWVVLALMELTF